jgi:hypothetical protein
VAAGPHNNYNDILLPLPSIYSSSSSTSSSLHIFAFLQLSLHTSNLVPRVWKVWPPKGCVCPPHHHHNNNLTQQ